MSCCEVPTAHVDALIAFALQTKPIDAVRWFRPAPREAAAWEMGRPWAPAGSDSYSDRARVLDGSDGADEVGRMLLAANYASLEANYGDPVRLPLYKWRSASWALGPIDPVKILSALHWYEYQTCEAPNWKDCEARYFCDALTYHAVKSLKGYEWLGVTRPEDVLVAGTRAPGPEPLSLYGMRDR